MTIGIHLDGSAHLGQADQIDKYHSSTDEGLDLVASGDVRLNRGDIKVIHTGLYLDLTEGWWAMVCSRSGLASKGIMVVNAPGIIDTDYTGEVMVILSNIGKEHYSIYAGDRIAQLVFMPRLPVLTRPYLKDRAIEDFNETSRGDKGLGSTGKR